VTASPGIRYAEDLLKRIESNPVSDAQIQGMDTWERWLLGHGMAALLEADLDEWEIACLECIVRHSGRHGRIPQTWLFEGGPDNDSRLRQLSCLSKNARKQRLSRLVTKLAKVRIDLELNFKIERASDCSKTIYTAQTSIVTMPRISARDRR
jgi:hypothetical protein